MKGEGGGGAARWGGEVRGRGEERKGEEYRKERLFLVLMKSDKGEQSQCDKFNLKTSC